MAVQDRDLEAQQAQPLPPPQQQQQQPPQVQEPVKGRRQGAPHLTLLDAPRWIASAHIVGYHYYHPSVSYLAAGGVWTQFFFMLGGFLLAYSEMTKPLQKRPVMSPLQYLRKRLVTIYPLYIFSLLLMVFTMVPRTLFSWAVLPLHFLLLQAILPICYLHSDGSWDFAAWEYNSVCWFISALIVYWLILRPLSRFFERVSLGGCYAWLLALWLWSVVPTAAYALAPPLWKMLVVNIVKAGPLGFIHVFVSGVVTARIFMLAALRDASTGERPTASFEQLTLAKEGVPVLFRFGCCMGYLLWLAIAAAVLILNPGIRHEEENLYYIFFHNGGAMPSMALVLLGSAVGADPIARLVFKSNAFKVLARVSYSQYLLQMPVAIFLAFYLCPGDARAQQRLPSHPQEPAFLISFPFVLLGAAYLVERCVGRPFTEWQRAKEREGSPGMDDEVLACLGGLAAAVRRPVADKGGKGGDSGAKSDSAGSEGDSTCDGESDVGSSVDSSCAGDAESVSSVLPR